MKKIVIASLAGVALVYGAVSVTAGYLGEKAIREQWSAAQSKVSGAGVALELASYKRGLFSSDVLFNVTSTRDLASLDKIQLVVQAHIQHGPIFIDQGVGVGLISSVASLAVNTGVDAYDLMMRDVFGPSLGKIYARIALDSAYSLRWELPAINYKKGAATFAMADSYLQFSGKSTQRSSQGDLKFGELKASSQDGAKVSITPMTASFDMAEPEPDLNIGNIQFSVEKIELNTPSIAALQLQNLTYSLRQQLVNKHVDTSSKVDIAEIRGPAEVSHVYYYLELNQVSQEAMQSWTRAFQNPPSDPSARASFVMTQLQETMSKVLQDGLVLKLALGAQYQDVKPEADWSIKLKPLASGKTWADISQPLEYLTLLDSDLKLVVPEVLAKNLPVQQFLGPYISQEGGNYRLKAGLHNAELVVGTKAIPQETLVLAAQQFLAAMKRGLESTAAAK